MNIVYTRVTKHFRMCWGKRKSKFPLLIRKLIYLSDVCFDPTMRRSVISISQLATNGFEIRFRKNKVSIGMQGQGLVSSLLQ